MNVCIEIRNLLTEFPLLKAIPSKLYIYARQITDIFSQQSSLTTQFGGSIIVIKTVIGGIASRLVQKRDPVRCVLKENGAVEDRKFRTISQPATKKLS